MKFIQLLSLVICAGLFGQSGPQDIDSLRKKAESGDPVSQYEYGRYLIDTKDVDVGAQDLGKSIDRLNDGFSWTFKAALAGLVKPAEYSKEELDSIRDWQAAIDESKRFLSLGRIKDAAIQAKDAESISEEKLRKHTWYAAGAYAASLEIRRKEQNWSEATKCFFGLILSSWNAYEELQEIPKCVEIPQHVLKSCRLFLEMKLNEKDDLICLKSLEQQIKLMESVYGKRTVFSIFHSVIKAQTLSKMGKDREAESEYENLISIADKYIVGPESGDWNIKYTILSEYADFLKSKKQYAKEETLRQRLYDISIKRPKIDIVNASAKKKLLVARVLRRVNESEEFKSVIDLPTDEESLRELADNGDPVACFKLSVLIKSGKIASRIPKSLVPLLPESKIYTDASISPFCDESRVVNYLNEKVCRRFVKLGHGYAQYELAKLMKNKNYPWPEVPDGCASQSSEHTKESFDMLKIAAKSGVPEALNDISSLYLWSSYYLPGEGRPDNEWEPYLGNDGNWYKKVYNYKNKDKCIVIKRLNNDPIVIRSDWAAAAHYAFLSFISGESTEKAYWLSRIYISGARASDDGYFDTQFESILPDKVEAAAWCLVCKYSKDNTYANNADAGIAELSLTQSEYEAAIKRAKELIKMRKEG